MRRVIVASVLTSLLVSQASAFDWNARTVTHELDVLDGRMKVESGHPLATARAFTIAAQDSAARSSLERVLQPSFTDHRSDALQTVLFGSWLNEVRTSLDMGGSKPLEWAARFMSWRYRKYLDGRERSDRWSEDTGYTSSNYQHSMLVTSVDPAVRLGQNESYDLIEEWSFWAMTSAIFNLTIAIKAREQGGLSADDIDLSWVSGLRYVGSVFHTVEDSSVSCSEAARRHVRNCLPGDGHGIVARTSAGRPQVVALSNGAWYERMPASGGKPHAALDGLYKTALIDEVYGEFDPARSNARILIAVTKHVAAAVDELRTTPLYNADGTPNEAFDARAFSLAAAGAREVQAIIAARYAAAADRQPLPPVPGRADGYDDEGDTQEDAGGCATSSNGSAALVVIVMMLLVTSRRRRVRRA